MNSSSPRFIISPTALFFAFVSMVSGIYMLLSTKEQSIYFASSFLPLYFCVLSFVSGYLYKNSSKSPVTIFLIGGYFIRMVIQPLLFCIGGYVSFYHIDISNTNIVKAVFLLCLESTFVFTVANYYTRRNPNSNNQSKIEPEKYDAKVVGWVLVLLALFLIYAYNAIPSLKSIYVFLPTADISQLANIRWDNETIVERGSITRYIYTLFTFIWPIVRSIMPAFCISQIYSRHGNSSKAILLSVLCLLIPSVFLGGDNIAPFMGAIYGLLVMHRLYGKRINRIVVLVCIVFGTAFVTIVSTKVMSYQNWRGANGISSIAQIVNAYFPGFENISICFSIDDTNKFNTLFYDLYYTIPFKETLFGLSGDTLSTLYTQTSQTGGQIVPWASQLSHYFTIIGSPLLTSIFVSYAFRCESISKTTNDFWEYYKKMYVSVLTAMSISIYSVSIYLRSYLNVVFPVILIIFIGNRKKQLQKNTTSDGCQSSEFQ